VNNLISEEQARAITGGRKPLVPIKYEEACKALVECQSIDDAKYFSDKADALAVWAKIYSNDEAGLEAKKLKLHAYRRMSQLADELRPQEKSKRTGRGAPNGPPSLLREKGFSQTAVGAMRKLGRLPEHKFEQLIKLPSPPSPTSFSQTVALSGSKSYEEFTRQSGVYNLRAFCNKNGARDVAKGMSESEGKRCRVIAKGLLDWLDEFEQHLPKGEAK
jgi:hypothetical protein